MTAASKFSSQVDLGGCLLSLPEADARHVLGALLPLVPLHAGFARQVHIITAHRFGDRGEGSS